MKVVGLALCERPTTQPTVEEESVVVKKYFYDLSSVPFFKRKDVTSLITVGMTLNIIFYLGYYLYFSFFILFIKLLRFWLVKSVLVE